MRVPTRFSIAVHVLSLLGSDLEVELLTSEAMARSIGVHPVIVRNVTGMLRKAGLISTSRGKAGASLARRPGDITLLDVYRAVGSDDELFAIHANPLPACPVGSQIQGTLEQVFREAQQAMEARLEQTSLSDVLRSLRRRARRATG